MAKIRLIKTWHERDLVEPYDCEKELAVMQLTLPASTKMAESVLGLVQEGEFLELRVKNTKRDRWETKWKKEGKASSLPGVALFESKQPAESREKVKKEAAKAAKGKVVPITAGKKAGAAQG